MSEAIFQRFGRGLLEQRWITGSMAMLLLVATLVLGWQWERRENADEVRQVSAQAQILAGSLSGAMAFDDRETVREYLDALRPNRNVRAAGVYGHDGRAIAGFARRGEQLPAAVAAARRDIRGGQVAVAVPVTEGSLELGYVYLRSSIEPLSARLSRYLAIAMVLVLAALLIALLGAANAAAAAANRRLQEQISAREQAEAALHQAQKMEALGQLTGGVAHDFNNLLMAASSGLELLDRARDDERRDKLKRAIRDALDRGSRITEQLLAFSRRRPLRAEIVRMDERIGKLAELLDHSLRENISVDFSIPDDIWPVEVDGAQFDIAILNLAVNAKDAMPKGGKLCISARNLPGALDTEDAIEISVQDDGEGMPAAIMAKAFEPFFTTKEAGRGTGLGLSQVYGFASASGGTARIDSAAGEGTTITLVIPRCELPEEAARGSTADELAGTPLQGLTILLVEDDEQLNQLIGDMLEESGAQVLRATSGAEGLRLFEQGDADAMLSDMVMPGGMDGLDLARAVRRRSPELPIVLMTGYSDAAGDATGEGYPLLRKPFTMPELVSRLGDAVAAPARAGSGGRDRD